VALISSKGNHTHFSGGKVFQHQAREVLEEKEERGKGEKTSLSVPRRKELFFLPSSKKKGKRLSPLSGKKKGDS